MLFFINFCGSKHIKFGTIWPVSLKFGDKCFVVSSISDRPNCASLCGPVSFWGALLKNKSHDSIIVLNVRVLYALGADRLLYKDVLEYWKHFGLRALLLKSMHHTGEGKEEGRDVMAVVSLTDISKSFKTKYLSIRRKQI